MKAYFTVQSTYDDSAYQALAQASWCLFRKEFTNRNTRPILVALLGLLAFNFIRNVRTLSPLFILLHILMMALVILAMVMGPKNTIRKQAKKAIKAAKDLGPYPADLQFTFLEHKIIFQRVSSQEQKADDEVRYEKISNLIVLGKWRFLFFGQSAFIIHADDLPSSEQLQSWETFIAQCTGQSWKALKGQGPIRRT